MNLHDRVHACLDGEIPREALSPDERVRLDALEATLRDTAAILRAAPAPDLVARVMNSLPEVRRAPALPQRIATALRSIADAVWRPRTLTLHLRPAYALAGGFAVLAIALVGLPLPGGGPAPVARIAAESAAPPLYVQFRLDSQNARRVALAGNFTDWQPRVELRETSPGVWSVLVPLQPGVHDYTFVVDGKRWVTDPHAPRVADGFGGTNSRLFLPSPEDRA
ncbi:MAG: glycogen-binding domain-containing protein [Gemmatimonadota bacterium]|nr:glycogen-binding domain-containing protein [Gemmatimonadota bacterium]